MNYDTNTRQPLHEDSHGDSAQPGPADGTEGVQRDGGASKDRPALRGVLSLGLTVLMAGAGVTLLAIAGARLIPVARGDLIEANSGAAVEVLTDVTHALTQDIERLTVPAMQRGQKLAQSDDLTDAVRDNNTQRITDLCNQAIQHATEIDAITVFDAEGEIVAINTVYRDGTVIPDDRIAQIMTRDYSARGIIMQCVKNSSRQEILEFQIDCDITPALFDSSGLAVAHSVPLYDRSGTQVGVVSTRMRFDRITSLIEHRSFAGGKGSIWFVTDDGRYFDEALNTGGDPPVPHDELSAMTKPLISQASEYLTFDHGAATLMLSRVSDLSTMEDGGIQVMTRVPKSWLTREARYTAMVGGVTPGAGGVLFLLLAILNTMGFKMRGQRDAARGAAQQIKTYEQNLKDSLAEAERVADELSATRKVMDKHTLFSIADRTGKIVDVNEGFCKISGYSREELLGQDHRMLNSGHHPKAFWKDMWRTLQSGKPWRGEVCNRAKDGSLYWVDSTNIPQFDKHGKIIRYVSLRFDITERKRLETQIESARDQFESLVGNIPGVTFRCRLDEQWTMIYMSDAVEQLTGYPVEEFIDNQARSYESVILSDDSTRVAEAVQRGVEAGNPWDIEYRIRRRNGEVRWVHEKGSYIAGEQPFLDGFIFDITDRVEARQRYELALEGSRDAIFDWDVNLGTVYYSPRWIEMLGLDNAELEPNIDTLLEFAASADVQNLENALNSFVREAADHLEYEFRMMTPDSKIIWALLRAAAQRRSDGVAERISGSVADITRIKVAEQEMRRLVQQDQLTGLASRAKLAEKLELAHARYRRAGTHCAVLFFDFDRFKVVNDSLGHQVGDELLCGIADRLSSNIREVDTAARFGGDEFVVLLEDLDDPNDAKHVAEKLLDVCAQPHVIQGHNLVSTASIGVVTTGLHCEAAADLLRDADTAMYQAKTRGRARVVEFDKVMHDESMNRLELEKEIRQAIDNEDFCLHYQPIVNLESGNPIGAEALARWEHPQRGAVSPGVFIPIAEDSNQMQALGDLVLRHACRQMRDWKQRQIIPPGFRVSVNLSKMQLTSPDFPEYMTRLVHDHGVETADIKVEVTETTIIDNRAGVAEVLREMRESGFVVMMDDFGTGHSSLSGLHQLPIDELKIDQSFIRTLEASRSLTAITSSIVTLAGNLSLRTVGEGIEDISHVALLQDIGCDYGQGYFFSKPVPPDQFERWLSSRSETKAA